ncbi:hypothetical protein GCM10020000_86140 [Streptomyces olivoverticillatus]
MTAVYNSVSGYIGGRLIQADTVSDVSLNSGGGPSGLRREEELDIARLLERLAGLSPENRGEAERYVRRLRNR